MYVWKDCWTERADLLIDLISIRLPLALPKHEILEEIEKWKKRNFSYDWSQKPNTFTLYLTKESF